MQRRKDYDHSRLLQKQYNRAAKTAKIAELTISQDMPAPPEFSHAQRNRFKNNVLTVLVLKTGLLGLQQRPGSTRGRFSSFRSNIRQKNMTRADFESALLLPS